jgi:hypothetical protein
VGTHRGGGTKWGGGERPTRWHSPSVRVMWWSLKLRGGMGKVSHRSIEAGMGRGRCSREDRRRGGWGSATWWQKRRSGGGSGR